MKKIKSLITLIAFSTLNLFSQYTKLLDFDGSNGSNPHGSLISDGSFLYGMTQSGGVHNLGTIFKIKIDGSGYVKLLDFAGKSNGSAPYGSLIFDGNFLYGTTSSGGTMNCGAVFKIKPNGTEYIRLLSFNYINGKNPYGDLTLVDGYLYGTTEQGGMSGNGVIFKIKTNGTAYATLFNFDDTHGGNPFGSLIYDGAYLYGLASSDAKNGSGKLFKIKPDGTGFDNILTFDGTNGSGPMGSLVSDGIYLYGMTNSDALNGYGKLFKIKTDGTGYSNLYNFNGINEGQPYYTSLVYDGTYLYGITSGAGTSGYGNIFKIKTDGTGFLNLMNFNGINGNMPYGSLISDGVSLYGMTKYGGANDIGLIFKYQYKFCKGIVAVYTQAPIVCNSLTVGNHTYTVSGTYYDTIKEAEYACDSVIITHLTVNHSHTVNQYFTKHEGQSVTVGNNTYATGGVYKDIFPGAQMDKCDSTVITHLTIIPKTNTKRVIQTLAIGTLSLLLLAGFFELFMLK